MVGGLEETTAEVGNDQADEENRAAICGRRSREEHCTGEYGEPGSADSHSQGVG